MSRTPEWCLEQAALRYASARECVRVRGELDTDVLLDALDAAAPDTWQCPAAQDFREDLLTEQGNILVAREALWTNATGLSSEGDNLSREAAHRFQQRREAAEQQRQAAARQQAAAAARAAV